MANGQSAVFSSNWGEYWGVMTLLIVANVFITLLAYVSLNLMLLMSSEAIHEDMIHSIVRSPASFFDTTPSGILTNKFSTDLAVLDLNLMQSMVDSISCFTLITVAFANIGQVNTLFIGPIILVAWLSIVFYRYGRMTIIRGRELYLQKQNPVFHFFS